MDRRELLGALGATAAGMMLMGGRAFAQGEGAPHEGHAHQGHGDIHERCAQACSDCMKECNTAFHHCFQQVSAGKQEHAKAMHLLADCGEFCATSAKLVARMSPLMTLSCGACGAACDATIGECQKFDSAEMKRAVDVLRKCSQSCHDMVKAMGGHHHGTAARES